MPDTLASCRWIGVTETGSATTSPPGAPFKPAGQGPRSSVTSVEVAASLSFEGRKGTRPPPSEPHGCPSLCAGHLRRRRTSQELSLAHFRERLGADDVLEDVRFRGWARRIKTTVFPTWLRFSPVVILL